MPLSDRLDSDSGFDDLGTAGFVQVPQFLDLEHARTLLAEARELDGRGVLRHGAVGRGPKKRLRSELRSDRIFWLDSRDLSDAQAAYWELMHRLKDRLNRIFYLGLFELEAHLACFPTGGFYRPHLDRHRGTRSRVVSAVTYLDEDWCQSDGGQLRIFTDREAGERGPYLDIFPEPGKLVLFLSGDVWHEVREAGRERHTLTGWFRRRESPFGLIDDGAGCTDGRELNRESEEDGMLLNNGAGSIPGLIWIEHRYFQQKQKRLENGTGFSGHRQELASSGEHMRGLASNADSSISARW